MACFGVERSKNRRTRGIDEYNRYHHSFDEKEVREFKEWIRKFDTDRDGRISRDELRQAMRAVGVRFTGIKCRRGMNLADADGDGYIDDSEIDGLIEYWGRRLGLDVVAY
uniref:EF-hand domain-containing protein n=1 Tax=Leersia perrieri TaxID=77586 RepID=A0A0D9XEI2_9ORYZ